jgi:putative hemolysin
LTRGLHARVMRSADHAGMDVTQLLIPPAVALAAARTLQPPAPTTEVKLQAVWATQADEVREAQRLRFRVFAEEMGARLTPLPGTPAGLDVDAFDAHCEHLLVRTQETDDAPSRVVGTYRVLTPAAAKRAGGLYSDHEFDLSRLDALRPRFAELGRSCTAAEFRTGGVILMLWGALAGFMLRNGLDITVGCASITMHDGGHTAASLWHKLRADHLVASEFAATPRLPLPVEQLRGDLDVEPPALIKGYLRCGGQVLGPPAWDPEFQTADLPMMMKLADLPASYRRRFIGA